MSINEIKTNILILGGGISGIAFSHFYDKNDCIIIEKEERLGGLCKSFELNNSMFDYSGHFLHFKNVELKKYVTKLVNKHTIGKIEEYDRNAAILLLNENKKISREIDYPFQANIHQLQKDEFLECLVDLWNTTKSKDAKTFVSFYDLVRETFGNEITNLFFRPYNEKLYKTKLSNMSADAMKRFIPNVSFNDVIHNFIDKKQFGYNSTFLYSWRTGIQCVVDALLNERACTAMTNEEIIKIDIVNKKVITTNYTFIYDKLINTLPLTDFIKLSKSAKMNLKYVDVHVYNIGYAKTCSMLKEDRCWVYIPDKRVTFYRVGFYDYMSGTEGTNVYVEVSAKHANKDKQASIVDIDKELKRIGLIEKNAKIKVSQKLLISPAYAILENDTEKEVLKFINSMKKYNIFFTGRYSKWTYQSIEDNILDARELASKLSTI